jgi:dihydrofolate reductase
MRKIFLFINVSLDGYFEAPGHDISWSHTDFEAFSAGQSGEVDTILLGHNSYQLMENFWPTPQAEQTAPEVARFMNDRLKVVATHNSFEPVWNNVRVISGDVAGEVKKLKEQPGKDIIMLGSNSLCVSLMQEGLVDEFQILMNPIALGEGTSLFSGLPQRAELTLTDTRKFKSGAILLIYKPTGVKTDG